MLTPNTTHYTRYKTHALKHQTIEVCFILHIQLVQEQTIRNVLPLLLLKTHWTQIKENQDKLYINQREILLVYDVYPPDNSIDTVCDLLLHYQ